MAHVVIPNYIFKVTVKQQESEKLSPSSDLLKSNTAGSRLADGLAKRYLPPVSVTRAKPKLPQRKQPPKHATRKPQINRTTLR